MLNNLTTNESGDSVRDVLEALLVSKADLEALKPLSERVEGAEQSVNHKSKQLEKATTGLT